MKKTSSILLFVAVTSFSVLAGCGENSKKDLKQADDHMKQADKELAEAAKATGAESAAKLSEDWNKFKYEADTTFSGMENNLKKLNQQIVKSDQAQKAKIQENVNKLEQKLATEKQKLKEQDDKIKADVQNFDHTMAEKNESFRREFRHDMHELAAAIKDLFTDNVK